MLAVCTAIVLVDVVAVVVIVADIVIGEAAAAAIVKPLTVTFIFPCARSRSSAIAI